MFIIRLDEILPQFVNKIDITFLKKDVSKKLGWFSVLVVTISVGQICFKLTLLTDQICFFPSFSLILIIPHYNCVLLTLWYCPIRSINEFVFFTLWWLNADNVAIDPNGPGLPFGPQQFTGKPAIGNGLFCWFSDCIFRDRLLGNWNFSRKNYFKSKRETKKKCNLLFYN